MKESKLREAEVKKDAMASKVGDLEMASQVHEEEEGREHLLKQSMYHVWYVFTTWLGSRGAPADAADPTEAGQLQGKLVVHTSACVFIYCSFLSDQKWIA